MRIVLNDIDKIKSRLELDKEGKVQKFFTNACAKHMDKYVPYDKGNLAEYKIDGADIVYNQLYAEYQYYGVSKSGKSLNYQKDKHPQANSYWDKRMTSAEINDVISEVQKYVRSRK